MSIPIMGLLLLVLATCVMAGYRKFVTREEDDLVHLGEGSVQHAAKQEALAKTLTQLDLFTKILVSVTVLYGLGLGATMVYQALQNGPASQNASIKPAADKRRCTPIQTKNPIVRSGVDLRSSAAKLAYRPAGINRTTLPESTLLKGIGKLSP